MQRLAPYIAAHLAADYNTAGLGTAADPFAGSGMAAGFPFVGLGMAAGHLAAGLGMAAGPFAGSGMAAGFPFVGLGTAGCLAAARLPPVFPLSTGRRRFRLLVLVFHISYKIYSFPILLLSCCIAIILTLVI